MFIDSELKDGILNYAEVIFSGESKKEIFFSTYFCHPSMANNECSGPALSAELIRYVAAMKKRRYTYRFIYIPETIGSITYMSQENHLQYMKDTMIAGFNLSCVGDDRNYSIVESRYADTLADKVLHNVLKYHTGNKYSTYSFLKRGSDERQYNAPGIELPVVCYCRSKFAEYPEYHTSADDMGLVSPSGFQGSYEVMTQVIEALENNSCYAMTVFGEPQLGKRGLYPTISQKGSSGGVSAIMNFIAYADGKNDLIDISNRINVPIKELIGILEKMKENHLVEEVQRDA
jgi:aminopeptidase-like protein